MHRLRVFLPARTVLLRAFLPLLLLLGLGGCAVYPAPYYPPRAYVAPPPPAVVYPRPYYGWGYRPYGWHRW